jgi:hypothetical protein
MFYGRYLRRKIMKKSIGLALILFGLTIQGASAFKMFCVYDRLGEGQKLCTQSCEHYGGFRELSYGIGYGGVIPDSFTEHCLRKGKIACGCVK